MKPYEIVPMREEYIVGFCSAVDKVSRERQYLAFLEGPPLEMSRAFVLENLRDKWPHVVAICEDKVVGWCDITSLHRPILAHSGVLGIGVIKDYRGFGIGEALMHAAIEQARHRGLTRIELTVRENNIGAIALYKKFGFIQEGFHRHAIRIDGVYENQISMALLFE